MPTLLERTRTQFNLVRHRHRTGRKLEIGPGEHPLPGFESLNIMPGRWVDYVVDAAGDLPFDDASFELIYASHVLEHLPWYQSSQVLAEWLRVLQSGGALEIWVPDGLKICQAFVEAELNGSTEFHDDGWFRFNSEKDPCAWAAGRLFTYGDGQGTLNHPNWHRAMFSPRRLIHLLEQAGFTSVRQMSPDEVRGADHGWINLGIRGVKP